MATRTVPRLLTAEEFALLPDPEDGSRMELVKGIVCMAPPPGSRHGSTVATLAIALGPFVRSNNLGRVFVESGFRITRNPDTVRGPDVSFVAGELADPASVPVGYLDGVPTLAIEVASPGDSDAEIFRKVGEYLDAGAARVWVVRPANRTVTVYRQGGDVQMYRDHEALSSDDAAFDAPGFNLPVAEIFA